MNELYEALKQIKDAARANAWYAMPEGTPERDSYTAAIKAINNYVPDAPVVKINKPVVSKPVVSKKKKGK